MTRHHPNKPAWDAIEELLEHYLPDEHRDYEGCPQDSRGAHVYPAWAALARWAAADREKNERGHNGWTNYETWAAALWLDNEEDTATYWRLTAREIAAAAADPEATDGWMPAARLARHRLARRLRDELEADAPDLGASLYADLLGAALEAVDWDEVAEGFLDAVTE